MVRRRFLLAAAVLTALALVVPATAAGAAVNPPAGLWASDYPAPTTIDDNGTVELGVKFITSAPLVVEGVRIYRVDAGDVTGTLWEATGHHRHSAGDRTVQPVRRAGLAGPDLHPTGSDHAGYHVHRVLSRAQRGLRLPARLLHDAVPGRWVRSRPRNP